MYTCEAYVYITVYMYIWRMYVYTLNVYIQRCVGHANRNTDIKEVSVYIFLYGICEYTWHKYSYTFLSRIWIDYMYTLDIYMIYTLHM